MVIKQLDIDVKIKNARLSANLTQEQAAELLDVSRQTISNWETGKTYPDIISVIKMSDVYDISLDHLLKEDKSMSNYLDYLEESTNTVKSKDKLSKLILILSSLGIWAISLIVFWFFISETGGIGYSLMFMWILLPVTIFVVSLIIGKRNYWGRWKWFSAVIFGLMYMLAEYATFSTANMIEFQKINTPDFFMILLGGIFSLIGLSIGSVAYLLKKRSSESLH
ncbi:transcriptional regulator with XRE-family HTH domain [Clostridiales Family XIII bacterium PM5-7]